MTPEPGPQRLLSEREIRVFISSTFRDMHAERDFLVRFVFPELRARCRTKKIHLIDVDLRWGVTEEDAESGKAIDICLDEIDSCRPYFIGLIGHRYGWVPPGHTRSITAQEIYHGVLHGHVPAQVVDLRKLLDDPAPGASLTEGDRATLIRSYSWEPLKGKYLLNPGLAATDKAALSAIFRRLAGYQKDRSLFFFRSEALSARLGAGREHDFFEAEGVRRNQVAALKQEIFDSGAAHFEYGSLEELGQLVQTALWKLMEADSGAGIEEKDWLTREDEAHELFMSDRMRRFVGRRDALEGFHGFCESDSGSRLLVVTGEPGCGKSALMARFVAEARQRHPDWLVLPHFIGASPSSASLRPLLRRLCARLDRGSAGGTPVPEETEELTKAISKLLARAAASRPVLLIIDGANQLEHAENALTMSWLPPLPGNARCVVSTLAGEVSDALLARAPQPQVHSVLPLSPPDVRELVAGYLSEIRHEFPNRALEDEFFRKVEGGNPLYILVALEELRVFGRFEGLGERIRELPLTVLELFDQVLARVEGDFGPGLVRDSAAFIACGRFGMAGGELQTLLRAHARRDEGASEPVKLPDLVWNRLTRSLEPYLFERSGVIDFFHGQLKSAVGKRYLSDAEERARVHGKIAAYFESRWKEPYYRALDELPHQMVKAGDAPGLARVLCDLSFIEEKSRAGLVHDLIADYRAAVVPGLLGGDEATQDFAHFVTAQGHLLRDSPELAFQQAFNEPDSTAPTREARKRLEEGLESRPFFRMVNKPAARSARVWMLAAAASDFAFSPDGSRIVVALKDNALRILDAATGRQMLELRGHSAAIHLCRFTADGRHVLSSSLDGALMVWDASRGHALATRRDGGANTRWFISEDGSLCVARHENGLLRVWDAVAGRELATFEGHSKGVTRCAFSPEKNRAVSASHGDSILRVWDIRSGKPILTLPGPDELDYGGRSIAFSPDGKLVAASFKDDSLRIWDAQNGREVASMKGDYRFASGFAFSPDGRRLVCGSRSNLTVYDPRSGEKLATWASGQTMLMVKSCDFSPDGTLVASFGYATDETVKLWEAATGKELAALSGHRDIPKKCAFSPYGSRMASLSSRDLIVWDVAAGQVLPSTLEHAFPVVRAFFSSDGKPAVSSSSETKLWSRDAGGRMVSFPGRLEGFSPDGTRLVTGFSDPVLKIWDAYSSAELKTLSFPVNEAFALSATSRFDTATEAFAFSPDGRLLASAAGPEIRLWDGENGQTLATLSGHTAKVRDCAFSLDGTRLVSADTEGTVRLWDVRKGVEMSVLASGTGGSVSWAFSPDGRFVASGGEGGIVVWALDQGTLVETLRGRTDKVESFSFSPDGRRLVFGSRDASLAVWDLEGTQDHLLFLGHANRIESCSFSPDGRHIISASSDRTVRVWNATTGKEVLHMPVDSIAAKPFLLSGDGRLIAVASKGGVSLWSITEKQKLAEYRVAGKMFCWAWDGAMNLITGTWGGEASLLTLVNVQLNPPLATAWRGGPGPDGDEPLRWSCPRCPAWPEAQEPALGSTVRCPECGAQVILNPFTIDADWLPFSRLKRQWLPYRELEQISAARHLFERDGDLAGVARCWNAAGRYLFVLGRRDEAEKSWAQAEEALKNSGLERVGAQGFVVRGDFYRRGALMDRALEQYQRAEGIYQAVGDLRGVADCWSARGLVEAERGNYPAALWQYSGAEAIFRQIDEPKYLGWCLFNQGAAYRNLSRWDDAKRCIMEALEIRRQLGDAPGVARCLSVLAAIHKDAGDAEAALACLKEEIEIYKEWEDSEGLATNVSRQVSLLKGPWARPEEANALIEDILEWTVREGRDDLAEEICRASGSLNRLAGHLLKLAGEREQNEDFGGALKSLTDHLRICRELGDGEGILAGFGRHLSLLRGVCQKPREAESIVRAVVKWAMHEGKIEWVPRICREAGPLEVLIPVLCDRGDFLASSDRREDALLLYGEAEKICRQLGLDEALRNCLDKKAAASKADQPR